MLFASRLKAPANELRQLLASTRKLPSAPFEHVDLRQAIENVLGEYPGAAALGHRSVAKVPVLA